MTMSPKEVLRAAVRFWTPDRLPAETSSGRVLGDEFWEFWWEFWGHTTMALP